MEYSMILGIDVSHWQDNDSTPQMMDFAKAKAAGARFVFIKASQSTWLDSDILMNWQHAKDAGLPRGAYHYMDWTQPAIDQAKFFCGLLKNDPGELPPVLDLECRYNVPSASIVNGSAWTFLTTVEKELGVTPILYTGPSYWKEFGNTNANWTHFPLWIANYTTADKPTIPAPWTDYLFWQFSAKGDGHAFGAESAELDMDWYNGDEAAFVKLVGVSAPPVELTDHQRIERLEGVLRNHGWM